MSAVSGPCFLATPRSTLYGILDLPSPDTPTGSAVLLCAPWGWDEVASYRSRKRWAERLAARGHPTLRFDLPATGNSEGAPGDAGLPETWLASIAAAAEWLREATAAPRVAALGLGLGGLLAREACSRGAAIEELITWAAPATGKAFVRETRAFSRMQEWHGEDAEALPEGAIEAGGFVLSAATIAALRELPGGLPAPAGPRRALLLGRDGVAADGIRDDLEAAGVEVSVGAGSGWGDLVVHPERTRLSGEVASEVEDWLASGEGVSPGASAGGTGVTRAERAAELDVGEGAVRESTWSSQVPLGRLVGVLCEPVGQQAGDVCAVFLNAGAVRSTGPNRLWVEMARRLARQGVRSLRVDLAGIGESDGDESRLRQVSEFYVPAFDGQVGAVLDELEGRHGVERFFLVGLCAGGFWSFRAAQRDRRVLGALLLNAGALTWHSQLLADREARKVARAIDRRWLRKLLRGEIRLARLLALSAALVTKLGRTVRGKLTRSEPTGSDIGEELSRLEDGTLLTMAFSGDEALEAELRAQGVTTRLESWPNVTLGRLPGSDHTLRPIPAQRAAQALVGEQIERFLASAEPIA
ncbi:MAG TPA: alpha/beta fold hydrolase [Solirubrobacterales bacterium]|nr:alpha/beta fold hydrolase [Solirubrobacterales bacterium]